MSESVDKEVYDELMELAQRVHLRGLKLLAEGQTEKSKKAAALVFVLKLWAEEWE